MARIGLTPLAIDKKSYVPVSIIESYSQLLKIASFIVPLTGLCKRGFLQNLEKIYVIWPSEIMPVCHLSLMPIDLDGFKSVNDLCGHAVGNVALRAVADILPDRVRKNDVVGRIGGDEFLICFHGSNALEDL